MIYTETNALNFYLENKLFTWNYVRNTIKNTIKYEYFCRSAKL